MNRLDKISSLAMDFGQAVSLYDNQVRTTGRQIIDKLKNESLRRNGGR